MGEVKKKWSRGKDEKQGRGQLSTKPNNPKRDFGGCV